MLVTWDFYVENLEEGRISSDYLLYFFCLSILNAKVIHAYWEKLSIFKS
jgi:hypothetical protein